MGFPDLAEHLEDRLGERENTLLVSLADDAQNHRLRVDRGDGQRDRLGDPQAIGVDEGETAAIDGLFQGGDQAAAVRVTAGRRAAAGGVACGLFFREQRPVVAERVEVKETKTRRTWAQNVPLATPRSSRT